MSQVKNKSEFEVEVGGKKIKLVAKRPDAAIRQQADMVWSKAWGEYAQKGVLLETKLRDVVRAQGVWDDAKEQRLKEIDDRIAANEAKLPNADGKVRQKGLRLSDVREAAIQMRIDRAERVLLLTEVTRLRNNTAEGLAENDRFNYLVANCIVDSETGKKPHFKSVEDYKARGNDADAIAAATAFAALYYDHDPDFDKKLPENQFLLKYKMVDESLALINKDGHLVDTKGRLVDKNGHLINEAGEFIDEAGNRIDDAGLPVTGEEFGLEDDWSATPTTKTTEFVPAMVPPGESVVPAS